MRTSHLVALDSHRKPEILSVPSATADARDIFAPTTVKSPIGALEFRNGVPTRETVRKLYDNLDLMHGIDAFLKGLPGVSLYRMFKAQRRLTGAGFETLRIYFKPISSKLRRPVPRVSRYEAWSFLNLESDGPMVIDFPPGMLGIVEDMWSRSVADLGMAGADAGRGGKYVLLPPHYKGHIPLGYTVLRPRTNGIWVFLRCLSARRPNNLQRVVAEELKIYSIVRTETTCPLELVDASLSQIEEIGPHDDSFYDDLDALVQSEPSSSLDKDRRQLFASIGIIKGRQFHPNIRMKTILTNAIAIGAATVRALNCHPRDLRRSVVGAITH